jgi:hypothetical protein
MKAKLMNITDLNATEKTFFGIKITGLRRPIFFMEGNDFFMTENKTECLKKIKEVNSHIKNHPEIESRLRANKEVVAVKF